MDRNEFTRIVDRYYDDVKRIAFAGCKNIYDSEDIAQTVFMKLSQYRGDFENDEHINDNDEHINDYVFKHADGSLYYPDYPTKAFRKIIKKIQELPQRITFHGLRSSCVSILVRQNMDVKSIQKWVGHTDIDTTQNICQGQG